MEELDDVQKIPASVAGSSESKTEKTSDENIKAEGGVQETSSVNINTSELPPHAVLGMPALSPTMVRSGW